MPYRLCHLAGQNAVRSNISMQEIKGVKLSQSGAHGSELC